MPNPENVINNGFKVNPQNINLQGRPKGARNRSTIYREHLEAESANGGQVVDDCVKSAILQALKGDIQALKELMDSAYGKNPDKLETTQEITTKQSREELVAEAEKRGLPTKIFNE